MRIAFTVDGKLYSGTVLKETGKSLLVEVEVPVKHNRKDFSATDAIGSTVSIERPTIHEIFND